MTSDRTTPTGLIFRAIEDKQILADFMIRHWGSPRMLVGMHTYDVTEIEGHGLYDAEGELLAFASWKLRERTIVLCALHALREGNGFATQMLNEIKKLARQTGARSIRSMVTNDNMPALVFYQKNGFRFATLYVGAVDAYRPAMPGMIRHGYLGLPIHDALELECLI
ncbi:MAG TPA: GNAT family N-acetyltransferase [Rhabdaerophilum sp.]|nr:GNAT family N-acetyltransferase [Rhabdaerophilum sp.]